MDKIEGFVVYPVRIERELYKKLCALAKADDRSVANFLRITIRQAVRVRIANDVKLKDPDKHYQKTV